MSQPRCPISGFDDFLVHRGAGEEDVEILFGEDLDGYLHLMEDLSPSGRQQLTQRAADIYSYVFSEQADLRLWMLRSGVPRTFIDRFVDLIWNWRLLKYDLRTHYLSVPKVQSHPLEVMFSPANVFRMPRQTKEDMGLPASGHDIFDPLQDSRRDYRS